MMARLALPILLIALSPVIYAQPKTTAYTYDALGRLTFVSDSVNGNRDYDYDKAGNRLLVSTNTATDSTSEPVKFLPAPTELNKSLIASCAWRGSWSAVSGAARYYVKDTSGNGVYVTTTYADIACPVGNSSGNMPYYVQACNADSICGTKAYF